MGQLLDSQNERREIQAQLSTKAAELRVSEGMVKQLEADKCGVSRYALCGCLGGFWLVCGRAPFFPFVRYQGTLSARGATVMPHGSAYCKSPNGRRFGSPAGQQPSSWEGVGVVVVFSLSPTSWSAVPWDCASRSTLARLSRDPRSDCYSPPQPLPSVSLFQK